MKVIDASKNRILQLGMQGEHDRTQVVFDCSDVIAEFPGGSVSLRVVTPGQTEPHPVMIDDAVEGKYIWTVSDSELAVKGIGECQLVYTFGDGKAKTRIWETSVLRALVGDAEPPSPWVDYVEAVEAAAEKVTTAVVHAPMIDETTGNWLVWDFDVGQYVDTGVHASGGGGVDPLKDIKKVKEYLYEAWFEDIPYDEAYEYFKEQEDPVNIGACSVVRSENLIGRNYDWKYDHETEFVVHVKQSGNRYGSIGVAAGFAALTGDDFIDSEDFKRLKGIIPFQLADGVNEVGLFAEMNVVPSDKGKNRVLPALTSEVELCGLMVVRYVLDHFKSAKEASEYLRDHATIYFPKNLHDANYELHYLIADAEKTYVVEFDTGATVIADVSDHPYMTNFHVVGITPNADGTVYTPETQDEDHDAMRTNLITQHGSGLERYNIIATNANALSDETGMHDLMNALRYTRAYPTSGEAADPAWYTEFVGGDLTCASPVTDFAEIMQKAGQAYDERSRDTGETWQTVHSAIYHIDQLAIGLIVQEDDQVLSFGIPAVRVDAEDVSYDGSKDYPDGSAGKEIKMNSNHRQATGNPHNTTFEQIADKPESYPPEYHIHTFESITDKPTAYPPEAHNHTFESITGKPDAYPPEDHEHLASEITYGSGTVEDGLSALNRDKVDKAGAILIGSDGKFYVEVDDI